MLHKDVLGYKFYSRLAPGLILTILALRAFRLPGLYCMWAFWPYGPNPHGKHQKHPLMALWPYKLKTSKAPTYLGLIPTYDIHTRVNMLLINSFQIKLLQKYSIQQLAPIGKWKLQTMTKCSSKQLICYGRKILIAFAT